MKTGILAILALLLSQSALAQHHGHRGHGYYGPRFGVYVGAPYPWFPPPAYYYPPRVIYAPVVTVREPTVYIEQTEALDPPPVVAQPSFEPGYWYYCHERGGYYPTVLSCPGTWQKVAPTTSR
jgi:hypothetical protein